MARRALLEGARAPPAARGGAAPADRRGDREEHRAAAKLRRRAAALRAAVPGGRCRPHRAAHRREGTEPRGERRALPRRGPYFLLSRKRQDRTRRLFSARPGARVESRAFLLVDDQAPAPLSRGGRFRSPHAARRARLHCHVAGRPNRPRRKLRRPAPLDLSKAEKLSPPRDVLARRHYAEADSLAQARGAAKKN